MKTIILIGNTIVGSLEHGLFKNLINSSISLENIHLSNISLNEINTKELSKLFANCSNLKIINLRDNKIVGSSDHGIFTGLIKSASSLEVIGLGSINLNKANAKKLSKILGHCSNLKRISLSGNEILGSSEHGIFDNLIKSASTLKSIDLQFINLKKKNSIKFSTLFAHCSKLKA